MTKPQCRGPTIGQFYFLWYRHAALTIIYLSDVPRSQVWRIGNEYLEQERMDVQDFWLKVVLFYQDDWTYTSMISLQHKIVLPSAGNGEMPPA